MYIFLVNIPFLYKHCLSNNELKRKLQSNLMQSFESYALTYIYRIFYLFIQIIKFPTI